MEPVTVGISRVRASGASLEGQQFAVGGQVQEERIERCLLLVGVADGWAVGGVIFGSGILGRECFRVFFLGVKAGCLVDWTVTTFTGGLASPTDGRGHLCEHLH